MDGLEEQIRRAMEEGQFSDLPGKGKPLRLEQNALEDPEWSLAYKILHNSGYTLPWIETRREIEADIVAARQALSLAWQWKQTALDNNQPADLIKTEWKRALAIFERNVRDLNEQILSYNLKVPSELLQRPALNLEKEIGRLTALSLSDTL